MGSIHTSVVLQPTANVLNLVIVSLTAVTFKLQMQPEEIKLKCVFVWFIVDVLRLISVQPPTRLDAEIYYSSGFTANKLPACVALRPYKYKVSLSQGHGLGFMDRLRLNHDNKPSTNSSARPGSLTSAKASIHFSSMGAALHPYFVFLIPPRDK